MWIVRPNPIFHAHTSATLLAQLNLRVPWEPNSHTIANYWIIHFELRRRERFFSGIIRTYLVFMYYLALNPHLLACECHLKRHSYKTSVLYVYRQRLLRIHNFPYITAYLKASILFDQIRKTCNWNSLADHPDNKRTVSDFSFKYKY